MPLRITGDRLDLAIEGLERSLNSPDLVRMLADDLADSLEEAYFTSGLQVVSGAGLQALTYVGEPQRRGSGWSIGVGDADALGSESEPAPKGVLRQFQEDYGLRPSPWKHMPMRYQDILASMRRTGMYGGRGPKYANYMWVQDVGSYDAYIRSRKFIDRGVSSWRSRADDVVAEWWESIGTLGRIKRTILGRFGR